MQDNNFSNDFITFTRTITPLPIEVKQGSNTDSNYIKWGEDNLYSNFLLKLFHEVPLHSDIVKTKVNYLMGDGLVLKGSNEKADFNVHSVDSFEEIVRKITLDFLIFNFYVLEVQYSILDNKPIGFNHIPAHHLRSNKSKTKFWICDDWQEKKNILSFDRWIKGKNEDRKSKIYMFSGYNPSVQNVYPVAAYAAAIDNMLTEILIKNFNKNNIEDGFSPAHIISFYQGIPTAEKAREFERKFEGSYKGENGLKYIINYNNQGDQQGLKIDSIPTVDYASALAEVRANNIESILTVHQATSRSLFGLAIEGSLGDKNTTESAYQIFKTLFVKDTRNVLESGLNKLLVDAGLAEIEFKDKTNLFTQELAETTREKVFTIDELRAIDNRPALPNGEGNKLIAVQAPAYVSTSTGSTTNTFHNDKYVNGRILKDEDFELVKDLGTTKENYSILSYNNFSSTDDFKQAELQFDDDADVEDYLLKEDLNGKTLAQIKAAIRKDLAIAITTGELQDRLTALTEANLITSEMIDGKVKIIPVKADKPRTVEVMYEYKVKAGFGKPLISTSRGFCVKLIDNDRLYSRAMIQQMSSILGYDVFRHSGGFYTKPDTGETQNQCRHEWNSVRVIRKDTTN